MVSACGWRAIVRARPAHATSGSRRAPTVLSRGTRRCWCRAVEHVRRSWRGRRRVVAAHGAHVGAHRRAGPSDLYVATRPDPTMPWSTPVPLDVDSASNDGGGTFAAGGDVLVFSSDRPGGLGLNDLYRAERAGAAQPFGSAAVIGGLLSAGNDFDAWLSDDERYVVFASDRSGTREIYEARR